MPTGQVKEKCAICTPGNFPLLTGRGGARGRLDHGRRSRRPGRLIRQEETKSRPLGSHTNSTETDDSAERKEHCGKPGDGEEARARRLSTGILVALLCQFPSSARSSDPV